MGDSGDYFVGELVRMSAVFQVGGVDVDPTTTTLKLLEADGTLNNLTSIQKSSTGHFYRDFKLQVPGRHVYRWESASPTGASEKPFHVKPTSF